MKRLSTLLAVSLMIISTGCEKSSGPTPPSPTTPAPSHAGQKVKKQYYTGGMLMSEFIMSDKTGTNGTLKRYGYDGKLTSIVMIKNGVKDGVERWFDPEGRVIQTIPYVNGRIDGIRIAYYPNGDPMIETTYKRGFKNGPRTVYKKDGTIHQKLVYRDNELVE
jgi:antitoxin component YwqK of YwqJK toxin-antitoxin module